MLYIYISGFIALALSTQLEIKSFKIWKWKKNK